MMLEHLITYFSDILPVGQDDGGLVVAWWLCAFCAAFCLFASELSGDSSMVDRLWSLTPAAYAWIFFVFGDYGNSKAFVMCILITMWSARLTYNFARKGGYTSHGEDYRWPYLKKHYVKSRAEWLVFNLTFIASYQNVLLLWIALPVHIVMMYGSRDATVINFNLIDLMATVLFLVFFLGETIADHQQFVFQTEKYRRKGLGNKELMVGDYKRGFLTSGLFRYSRHPNFFCEQAMWVTIYAFTISSTNEVFHVSGLGCIQLILLFQGSTWLTEKITLEKYPEYKVYQQKVSRLVPLP